MVGCRMIQVAKRVSESPDANANARGTGLVGCVHGVATFKKSGTVGRGVTVATCLVVFVK